ncbi:gp53-like domain-containing protein [Serratia odorifera]|uniref:gp53-like domain-containing protein n=1 Tax=Serratia odorifera TaxID=618 RepID=UPI003D28986A
MHRIDTPTAQIDKFGQGKNGFTNGDQSTGRRATDLNSDMWDAVQEEIANAIEKTGIVLDKNSHDQLYKAIQKTIEDKGYVKKSGDKMTGDLAGTNITANRFKIGGNIQLYDNVGDLVMQVGTKQFRVQNNGELKTERMTASNDIFVGSSGGAGVRIYTDAGDLVFQVNDKTFKLQNNGEITSPLNVRASGRLYSGDSYIKEDGNIFGTAFGGFINDWIERLFNKKNTADMSSNGWERDGSTGRIRQWGTAKTGDGGEVNVTFPISFSVACRGINATNSTGGTAPANYPGVENLSTNGFKLRCSNYSPGIVFHWEAWGL